MMYDGGYLWYWNMSLYNDAEQSEVVTLEAHTDEKSTIICKTINKYNVLQNAIVNSGYYW